MSEKIPAIEALASRLKEIWDQSLIDYATKAHQEDMLRKQIKASKKKSNLPRR